MYTTNPDEQHRRPQLRFDLIQKPRSALATTVHQRLQHRPRHPRRLRSKSDRFRCIHARRDTTGRDDRFEFRSRLLRQHHRSSRRHSPLPKRFSQRPRRPLRTLRFHRHPTRSTGSRDIDVPYTSLRQFLQRRTTKTTTRFFRDHRHTKLARQALESIDDPAEISIAFRLNNLLRGIEMHTQRIRTDGIHELSHLIRRQRTRLNSTDISKHERRRSDITHGIRIDRLALEDRALTAQAKPQATFFRQLRQLAIDVSRLVGPPRHRRDDDRHTKTLPEQLDRRVDVADREFGDGVVDKLDIIEKSRLGAKSDISGDAELDMVGFAGRDRFFFGPGIRMCRHLRSFLMRSPMPTSKQNAACKSSFDAALRAA